MAVNWGMLAAYPNAGEAFNQSFQQGQQQARQNMVRAAMAALAQDPNNPRALAALAQADPQTAMAFNQQRVELARQQLAQHQDNILKGAEILREFKPKDQASYTAALAAAQQAGVNLTGVPQEYNQQYVDGVVHLADALKPSPQDPSPIREYQDAISLGYLPKETNYQQFLQMKNPGMMSPVTIPYGATVTNGGGPAGVPQVHDQASYDAVPAGSQYMGPDGHIRVKGGSTAPAPSSGFPGPH